MTVGVLSSASTWVTNIVVDLLTFSEGPPLRIFADTLTQAPTNIVARSVVAKSHHPRRDIALLAATGAAKVVMSVRDPRDCTASLMQRFGRSASRALEDVSSCLAYMDALRTEDVLLLKYEDRFFESSETVGRIAHHLALKVSNAATEEIFARFEAHNVRNLIERIPQLPADEVSIRVDSVAHIATGFHTRHMTDTRSGKYLQILNASEINSAEGLLAHALKRYGYKDGEALLKPSLFSTTDLATYSDDVIQIRPGTGRAVFGPYIHLPAGAWQAKILTDTICSFDIVCGETQLAQGASSQPQSFHVIDPGDKIEFRLYATQTSSIFSGVQLERI